MTPQERLALALEYQRKQSDPLDTVPVAGVKQPLTPNEMTWMDRITNMSAGLGKGIEGQLEGYKQLVTHPVQSAKDTVQALGTMVKNPSVIVDALKGMGEKATSGAQGLGEVVGANMTLNPRKLAMALAHPKIAEMTVYHGTPHTFPAAEGAPLGKFDASKIGTGEGAQAYGHGLYVAENPEVASGYKKSPQTVGPFDEFYMPPNAVDEFAALRDAAWKAGKDDEGYFYDELLVGDFSPQDILRRAEKSAESAQEIANARNAFKTAEEVLAKYKGSLYTVDLPDEHIEKMLDWDKPLSEQSPFVLKALGYHSNPRNLEAEARAVYGTPEYAEIERLMDTRVGSPNIPDVTGQEFYRGSTNAAERSEWLRSKGIPGIKYFDAGSRDVGNGTRNFVIFPGEEHNLKILERNGQKPTHQELSKALQSMPSKQDVQVDLYPVTNRKDTLNLARLVVDPEKRKQGLGSKAMQEIIDSADADRKTITLSPSTDFGATSVTRLKDFYKKFGFVENKGRNKDFTISESMYRVPKSLENE